MSYYSSFPKVFLEKTNNFDLYTKNNKGKTLGGEVCVKFQNLAKGRLWLRILVKCEPKSGKKLVTIPTFYSSKQEVECEKGNVKLTGPGGSATRLSITVGTLLSLFGLFLFYINQF